MANDPESFSPFSWRHWLRSIFQLSASPWRWMVGLEVGIASLLLLSLFTLSGYQPLGLIATLGSFTGLYGGALRRIDRMRLLPLVGLGFIVASAVGVLCAGSIWATVACLIVMTALACAVALGWGLGPPGAMQFVLVAGISGHMVAALRSEGGPPVFWIPLLVAAGALCSYLVAMAPLLLPAVRAKGGSGNTLRQLFPQWRFSPETRIIFRRVMVSVTLASAISLPLGIDRIYWVVVVAGVVLQVSHAARVSIVRAANRVLGTALGFLVFGLILWLQPGAMWLVLVVALLQAAVEVVVARNYALGLIFITPVALTIVSAAHQVEPALIMRDRFLDTLLGAVIAIAVLLADKWLESRRR